MNWKDLDEADGEALDAMVATGSYEPEEMLPGRLSGERDDAFRRRVMASCGWLPTSSRELRAKLAAERAAKEEARYYAVAALRYGEVCECDFHYEKHCLSEACKLPWEPADAEPEGGK